MRKILLTAFSAALILFLVNIAIIHSFKPDITVTNHEDKAPFENHLESRFDDLGIGEVKVAFVDTIESGGVLGLGFSTGGYVDMISSDPTIYVTSHSNSQNMLILSYHESAHVLQKELIAQMSNGYPDEFAPATSVAYYANLVSLSIRLDEIFPTTVDIEHANGQPAFPSIETSADCMAQVLSWQQTQVVYSSGAYVDQMCTNRQLAASLAIIDGTFPSDEAINSRLNLFQDMYAAKPAPTTKTVEPRQSR